MKKQMICITGNIAVGKSEVAKEIADILNWDLYKASTSFREMARNMNMSLAEFGAFVANNPDIDKQVELNTKIVTESKDKLVVDARLGFYVAQEAYKVYMTSELDVAARRLWLASKTRGKEENYSNVEEAKKGIIAREKTEKERYKKLYGVDIHDLTLYDLVIDTTNLSSHEAAMKIIEAYKNWEGV